MTKIIRIAVSVALVAWVARQTDWGKVGEAFARLRLELWLAAVGLLAVTQLVSAFRWQVITRALGFGRPLRQLTGIYLIGMYFNLLLPTSVGGDVVRAWYLDGGSGRRLAAFTSVLLDRLSGLLVLLAMACVALVLCPLENLPAEVSLFVWGSAAAALVGLAALPLLVGRGKQGAWRRQQFATALTALRSPRVLLGTTVMSLWVQAANVIVVWLVGLAIDAPVPGVYYWIMVPMVSLLTMLPVSVNGIGVRDEGIAWFLVQVGVARETGVAVPLAVLWLAVYTVTSLAGGLVYLFGHFPRPATTAEMSAEGAGTEPSVATGEERRAAA